LVENVLILSFDEVAEAADIRTHEDQTVESAVEVAGEVVAVQYVPEQDCRDSHDAFGLHGGLKETHEGYVCDGQPLILDPLREGHQAELENQFGRVSGPQHRVQFVLLTLLADPGVDLRLEQLPAAHEAEHSAQHFH